MNKLSIALLVATIFAVNTQAMVQKPSSARMVTKPDPVVTKPYLEHEPMWEEIPVLTKDHFDKKMAKWNTEIAKKPDAERTELYAILNKIRADRDIIMAEYQKLDFEKIKNAKAEKYKLMKELDKKLRNKTAWGNTETKPVMPDEYVVEESEMVVEK